MTRRRGLRQDAGPGEDVGVEEKVSALRRAETYPEPPGRIEPIETHMSWVFLTDRHAYKLKKPVLHRYLDFTTLAARQEFCEAELALNQTLAQDVYLAVVPLCRAADGTLRIGGDGEAVDHLIKTRRLPADRMLDRVVLTGEDVAGAVVEVVRRLVRFYRDADVIDIAPADYAARLERNAADHVAALRDPAFGLPTAPIDRAEAAIRRILGAERDLLETRARDRRIVDAHGDLRPEHIVLEPEPKIIDRLEFNPLYRQLDPADEIAYLALECEQLGAASVGRLILETYRAEADDPVPERLTDFYKCVRALLRAKLSAWHVQEPRQDGPARWLAQARAYLGYADRYAGRLLDAPSGPRSTRSTIDPPS